MSNAPYLSQTSRSGTRIGHSRLEDHMFIDGLEDAFQTDKLMGHFAEECAEKYQFTREDQDSFAIQSLERASLALKEKKFESEITPIMVTAKGNKEVVLEAVKEDGYALQIASYLLIGFYFKKQSANNAAIKAFLVNRVGDFGPVSYTHLTLPTKRIV